MKVESEFSSGLLFFYVLCITSALAFGALQNELGDFEDLDDRGLRLGAGLAEGGETGLAYTLMLLFPSYIDILSFVWLMILFWTVFSRTRLAWRMQFRQSQQRAPIDRVEEKQ